MRDAVKGNHIFSIPESPLNAFLLTPFKLLSVSLQLRRREMRG
jgi:hypothetical protein